MAKRLTSYEMNEATWVQILDEAANISLYADALGKGIESLSSLEHFIHVQQPF